jgi:hypothetical protein
MNISINPTMEPSSGKAVRTIEPFSEESDNNTEKWEPTGHQLLIIITLAILNLMIALDTTIIVTGLSVSNSSTTHAVEPF